MVAEDLLAGGEYFQLIIRQRDRAQQGLPSITVLHEGSEIAHLTWAGTIINRIQVEKAWRRRGLATAMYRRALRECPELSHDSEQLSSAGRRWAAAVG